MSDKEVTFSFLVEGFKRKTDGKCSIRIGIDMDGHVHTIAAFFVEGNEAEAKAKGDQIHALAETFLDHLAALIDTFAVDDAALVSEDGVTVSPGQSE